MNSPLQNIKKNFPIFESQPDLVYLDSAATSLKPESVIEAEKEYLECYSANIARGLYPLAEKATERFEAVRNQLARFLGATSKEIIFTSGTTDAINLAARLLSAEMRNKDNIVTTEIEHHSNYLPWKELAREKRMDFRVVPLLDDGAIDRSALKKLIDQNTRIVAFSAVSNVLGTIQPVEEIVKEIRSISPGARIIVDAAQAVGHRAINVKDWDADFLAFSGHKAFGPTGMGVLYGKEALLQSLRPVSFGGGMVLDACSPETIYRDIPFRFEAGTSHIGGIIAFGAALDFVEKMGLENIRSHEIMISQYTQEELAKNFTDTITLLGPKKAVGRGGVLAFTLAGIHPHDIAQILGEKNICIRAGEHCAAPLHRRLGLAATARISFSVYNTPEDIDALVKGLKKAQEIFTK